MNEITDALEFARHFRARHLRTPIILGLSIYAAFGAACRVVAAEEGNHRVTVIRDDDETKTKILVDLDDLELRA